MENPRLTEISLCVLVAGGPDAIAFERIVKRLFMAGVRMVQIRDKELSDDVLLQRVRSAVTLARRTAAKSRPLVIVNDRVHVAAAAGADGVHGGSGDMPVLEARHVLGSAAIIGRTAHSLDEAREAVASGADYLGVGPCFPSTTKSFALHASRDFLAAAATLPLPVFAIGGITVERFGELRSLGITRVAVAAAITAAPDPAAAARRFLEAMAV
jgi:thiamine-phosphate pyrophosphorylase